MKSIFYLAQTPQLPKATHLKCDVIKDSFPAIEGVLNGLVYCPGSINLKTLAKLTIEDFQKDFEINCLGAIKTVKAYLSYLQGGHAASILFFSTVAVQRDL